MKHLRAILIFVTCVAFAGCKLDPFETLGPSEHGVVFSALPTFLGGGVEKKVYSPKQKVMLWPWQRLYRMDTGLQTVTWGGQGEGDDTLHEDFVQTRAIDGNEVALTMTVTYRIRPEQLGYVIQKVGIDNDTVKRLVTFVARSDIRLHMNYLKTEDFRSVEERQKRVEQVKSFMNERLQPEGIDVIDVIFVNGLFYRQKSDGTMDTSYQDQMNEEEQTNQKTIQERNRIKTVEEEMKQKFAEAEGSFFRVKEQADGQLRQAENRGNAKYEALLKDAERVHAVGMNEIEGMRKEIEALSGPGGRAILRKEVAKALAESNARFVVMNGTGSGAVDVNRMDANELIRQAGIFSALSPAAADGGSKSSDGASSQSSPKQPAVQAPAANHSGH
ncbi:MAG: SPFH domain-containing protein [Bdellovibrionota bacterium]